MTKRSLQIGRTGAACAAVLALLVTAMPVAAAPARPDTDDAAFGAARLVDELTAHLGGLTGWLAGWLGEAPVESVSAQGRGTMDPNGEPTASSDPDLGGDGGVATQGRGTMDPDG